MIKNLLVITFFIFAARQDALAKMLFAKVETIAFCPTKNERFSNLLQKKNISLKDIDQASNLMRTKYNITKVEPEQKVLVKVINWKDDNLIEQIRFTKNPKEEIVVSRSGSQFNTQLISKKDIKKQVIKVQGRVIKNISELKLPKKVLDNIINIVGDMRPNTNIELLVEVFQDSKKKILGYGDIQYINLTHSKGNRALYRYLTKEGSIKYIDLSSKTKKIEPMFVDPINGNPRISSKYGNRKDPISGSLKFHRGVDFAAQQGTPIRATRDGYIKYLGLNGGYGKFIKIAHDNNYETAYAHLSNYNSTLKVGSRVSKGQIIGYVGSTGKSTGPHLHYEIIHKSVHVDPIAATKALYVQEQSIEDIDDIKLQVAEINSKLTSLRK